MTSCARPSTGVPLKAGEFARPGRTTVVQATGANNITIPSNAAFRGMEFLRVPPNANVPLRVSSTTRKRLAADFPNPSIGRASAMACSRRWRVPHPFFAVMSPCKPTKSSIGPSSRSRACPRSQASLGPALARAPSRRFVPAGAPNSTATLLGATSGWLRVAIAVSVYGGLRMGEVRALEVRDVDFKRGHILVRHVLSADEILPPKSGHERVVPLAPDLRVVLEDAVRLKMPHLRLVMNERGETPTCQRVLGRFKRLERQLGVREWSFHSLRHYFCSTLIRRGASVEAVRLLAGHSKLDVTQRYVRGATADDLRAAIARLPG